MRKKLIFILAGLAFLAMPAAAQFTTVTGTVTDTNGLAWDCGTISAQLVTPGGTAPTLNGLGFTTVTSPVGLGCSQQSSTGASGSFTMRLADNNVVLPSGTQWKFIANIAPGILPPGGTGPQSCTATVTITGASQSITSSFSACPALSKLSSASANSIGSVFSVLNYGWVDDDSTDNCAGGASSHAQAWLNAVNGYTGPGIAQAIIPEGAAGKAYKLTTCNLIFTQPVTLYLWGTLDCQQNATFANCIQQGPSGLVNFSNVQTPPYTISGTGVLVGCANVTVACIESMKYVSNPRIYSIHMANVGAGNATIGNCTNYAISFDGGNNAPEIIGTEYWNTDATTGRCWSVNNRLAIGGGTNTALIAHNTIIGAGAAPGFTTPCGSIGHLEEGSATLISDSQFYGFGVPIDLGAFQTGVDIHDNLIDQAGCTGGNAGTGDIDLGEPGGGNAGTGATITNNYFTGGHATWAVGTRGDASTATLGYVNFTNNRSNNGSKNIFSFPATQCLNVCIAENNIGFALNADSGAANCQGANSPFTSPAACGAARRGYFAIPASTATYTINTTAVTPFSEIFLQQITYGTNIPSAPTCNGTITNPIVSSITGSTSFTFTLTSTANITCYYYIIKAGP